MKIYESKVKFEEFKFYNLILDPEFLKRRKLDAFHGEFCLR